MPNAVYHARLVASNSAGTTIGADVTFTTLTDPSPGPPVLGRSFNISPVSGLVLIEINGHLVPLTELRQIGPNMVVDARRGTIELTTSTGHGQGASDAAANGNSR